MNEQQMQQLLAFMQQQMQASQQNMADLPQRAMQAGATSTQGSGGTILSPDPVRRVQQANEAWRERFPNVVEQAAGLGMTPEALLASRGNDATNQWAQLGGIVGVDPQKMIEMNRNARAFRQFAEAQRNGTNGRVLSVESGMTVPTTPAPQPASPATPATATPVTAGLPGLDIFGPNPIRSGVQSYVENAPEAWREAVIPNAPRNTSVAPPIEGSNLRQNVLQGLNFIPNMLLGAGSTIAEGLGSIFGKQVDLPQTNLQSDFFSNLKTVLGGIPAYDASQGGWQNETTAARAERLGDQARQYENAFTQVRNAGGFDSVSGANPDAQREMLVQNQMQRNANPAAFTPLPQAAPQMQLAQPPAMMPQPQSSILPAGMFTPPAVGTVAVEDPRKKKQQQPVVANAF